VSKRRVEVEAESAMISACFTRSKASARRSSLHLNEEEEEEEFIKTLE